MDQESSPQKECRMLCGFYASPLTEGLCSVCYRNGEEGDHSPTPESQRERINLELSQGLQRPRRPSTPSPMGTSSSPASSGSSSTFSPIESEVSLDMSSLVESIPSSPLSTLLNASPPSSMSTASPTSPESMEVSNSMDGLEKAKKSRRKNRCQECKKKIGLTGFACRCGGVFCGLHRYSDKHPCDYDYKEAGAAEIRKSNPVVAGEKVQRI